MPGRREKTVPISVVTIEREYGSGGAAIAEILAKRLGWALWDRNLTSEILKMSDTLPGATSGRRASEQHDPLLYRLAKVFARGSYERTLPLRAGETHDAERIVQLLTRVIERVGAGEKAVIVGRGGAYILRNHPTAFHVFVFAPYEEKLRRVIASGKSEAEAAELLETVDQERGAFVKRYTGRDWPNRYLYNLWINSIIGDDAVVQTMLSAISMIEERGIRSKPSDPTSAPEIR